MTYRLSDADIRLLHVYRVVVECRGFSNAQAVLNVSQPTISSQISQLEKRLGLRLCERGRSGFRLTEEGRRVYNETLKLLKAHEDFRNATSELRGHLAGFLHIGLIDNIITDPNCPIVAALNAFNAHAHDVAIRLEVLAPSEMERLLLDGSLDVAVGTFHHRLPGLTYRPLYTESHVLVCGRQHPLFRETSKAEIQRMVADARKVTRGYLDGADILPLSCTAQSQDAIVQNMEAGAILILGGGHIGFLPDHYAKLWIANRQMKIIALADYKYKSEFSVVTSSNRRTSRILSTFLGILNAAPEHSTSLQAAR